MIHIHREIKCGKCGYEFCYDCHCLNGCPKCNNYKAVVTTTEGGWVNSDSLSPHRINTTDGSY